MLQELQIQSNLPLIILTILVICIVVIGYLELKKVHNSIDTLNNRIDSLKKNETDKIDMKNIPLKASIPVQKDNTFNEDIISDQQMDSLPQGIDSIQKQMDNNPEEINSGPEEMDGIPPGIPPGFPIETMMASMPFGNIVLQGGSILPMGFEAKNMDHPDTTLEEEDIDDNQEINEQVLTEENIQEIKEVNNLVEEMNNSYLDDNSNISELSNSDEEDSDEGDSDSEDSDEEDQENQVNKNINFDPIIQINDSLSVKELKNICENMNISQSGNKSQLIQRIKQHQN
tara:strand:+ start:446 stop:1303 length:858 start_codon:yes stop_codon:yes gene_type:complete